MNQTIFILLLFILSFCGSIFGDEVKASLVSAPAKKALNKFLPKANPDNCTWSYWANEKGYFADCKLVEGDESSPTVEFKVGKNGQSPSLEYSLKSDQFSGQVPDKVVSAATEALTKLEGDETRPDEVVISLGPNAKVIRYSFIVSFDRHVSTVDFNGAGKQIGKAQRHGRGG